MKLKNDKCSLTLTLTGYQFPELANVPYDSNWLNVKLELVHEGEVWSAIDPALFTYEVNSLIGWLRGVSAGKYDERHLWFTEPCISFHLSPAEGEPENLVVELRHEFRPSWANQDLDVEFKVKFSLASIDLTRAAQSLENQLCRYPQRTEH